MKRRDQDAVAGLRVAGLRDDVAGLRDDVAGLRDDVAGLRDDVAGLRDDVAGLRDDVAGLRDDVAGLRDDVAGLRDDVAALRDDVAGLRDDVAGLRDDVAGLRDDVAGLRDAVVWMRKNATPSWRKICYGIYYFHNRIGFRYLFMSQYIFSSRPCLICVRVRACVRVVVVDVCVEGGGGGGRVQYPSFPHEAFFHFFPGGFFIEVKFNKFGTFFMLTTDCYQNVEKWHRL